VNVDDVGRVTMFAGRPNPLSPPTAPVSLGVPAADGPAVATFLTAPRPIPLMKINEIVNVILAAFVWVCCLLYLFWLSIRIGR
jgi:hypothetical protein